MGELVTETNPKNATTTHQYDALARMLKTVDTLAGNTGYSYDVNDRVTQVTAPNNATTQHSYDDLGCLVREISPDRGTTVYNYDAAGNLLSQSDAHTELGIAYTTAYTYDNGDRILTMAYPDGRLVSYTRNAIGRISAIATTLNGVTTTVTTARDYSAYGFARSSNYNTRPRAAEIMVDGATSHVVRRRETIAELMMGESVLP